VEKVPLTDQAYAGGLVVGSMKKFGGVGKGLPPRRYKDASGNYVDPSGNMVDQDGNRMCVGAIEMPGGPAPPGPGHIRPRVDVRPDCTYPIRVAGVTEGSYAPA
jgi:hypothetical protein